MNSPSSGPADERGRVLDPVGLLVGVVVPLAFFAAIVFYAYVNADALPREYPSHWGASGDPDGWSDPVTALGVPLGVALLVAFPMTAVAAFARIDLLMRRLLLVIGLGVLALIGSLTADPLVRIVGGETDPGLNDPAAAASVALALLVGAGAALCLRDGRPVVIAESPPDSELPRAPLAESTVSIPPPRWVIWTLAALVGGTIVVVGIIEPWLGVAIALLVAPTLLMCAPFRVHVGPGGLTVSLGGVTVTRVGVREIAGASVAQLEPWKYGGGGYRFTGNGVAIVWAAGPGLRVELGSGRHLLLGCSDGDEATRVAGVLNSAADARRDPGAAV